MEDDDKKSDENDDDENEWMDIEWLYIIFVSNINWKFILFNILNQVQPFRFQRELI